MQFGPPTDEAEVSPWRWRIAPRPLVPPGARVIVVLLALFVIVAHVVGRDDEAKLAGEASFDGHREDLWFAIAALGMIGCVRGDAAVTLVRDAVMLLLAAVPAVALVDHVYVVGVHAHCSLFAPFSIVPIVVAAHAAIDLAMLRPVFAALRARRPRPLPRARGPR